MNDKFIPVLAVVGFLVSKLTLRTFNKERFPQANKASGVCVRVQVDGKGKISTEDANRLIDMYSTEAGDAKEKTKQAVTMCAREANTAQNRCEVAYRMMRCALRTRGVQKPQHTRSFNITLPQSITLPLPLPPIRFPALINIPLGR